MKYTFIDRGFKRLELISEFKEPPNMEYAPHKWRKNTILIATDSIFNQINEKMLSRKFNIKVRAFNGATIEDMYYYLYPLLKKEPDHILLHVGSNNTTNMPADEILSNLLQLKHHISNIFPSCNVVISQPIIRADDRNAVATTKEYLYS